MLLAVSGFLLLDAINELSFYSSMSIRSAEELDETSNALFYNVRSKDMEYVVR